ncbi:MAG: acyloxyacyl hydrolase [Limisphaerales bacterium]
MTSLTRAADLLQQPPPSVTNTVAVTDLSAPKSTIWQDGVGNGFLRSAQNLTIEAGAAAGMAKLGSHQAHDLGLLSVAYGHMLGGVMGRDHWYRGNFEGRMELFGGMQFRPDVDTDGWLIGLTPHLRYNFATGTRWIPFMDGGAGVTAMGIGPPDVSGTFEFNSQASAGVHWFLRDNLALTSEVKYTHYSCAGIHSPNSGINTVAFMFGVTWFFGK